MPFVLSYLSLISFTLPATSSGITIARAKSFDGAMRRHDEDENQRRLTGIEDDRRGLKVIDKEKRSKRKMKLRSDFVSFHQRKGKRDTEGGQQLNSPPLSLPSLIVSCVLCRPRKETRRRRRRRVSVSNPNRRSGKDERRRRSQPKLSQGLGQSNPKSRSFFSLPSPPSLPKGFP